MLHTPKYAIQLRLVVQEWDGFRYRDVAENWADLPPVEHYAGTSVTVDEALVIGAKLLHDQRHEITARAAAMVLAVSWKQGVLPFD